MRDNWLYRASNECMQAGTGVDDRVAQVTRHTRVIGSTFEFAFILPKAATTSCGGP